MEICKTDGISSTISNWFFSYKVHRLKHIFKKKCLFIHVYSFPATLPFTGRRYHVILVADYVFRFYIYHQFFTFQSKRANLCSAKKFKLPFVYLILSDDREKVSENTTELLPYFAHTSWKFQLRFTCIRHRMVPAIDIGPLHFSFVVHVLIADRKRVTLIYSKGKQLFMLDR